MYKLRCAVQLGAVRAMFGRSAEFS